MSTDIEPQEFKQEYQGEIIPMLPSDIPADDELLFDDPRLTKANSIYLTIQQKFFDEIVSGKKTIEYREIKPTTYKNYLCHDEIGPIPYSPDIDWPEIEGLDLNFYNNGKFPFMVGQDINFIKFKAGATAKDMDSAVVEVKSIKMTAENRFDFIDEKFVKNPTSGQFCLWIAELHLGKVRGVYRKSK
ncbi:MAG: ASCH domain-containing protein [Bacteroidales bacterium]|nr:ASCH domain-containing protein [Bacteroidales bacterium]